MTLLGGIKVDDTWFLGSGAYGAAAVKPGS
jgi:hypothetical protein